MISRISLDSKLIAQQAILTRLSTDLSSALTLCFYPTTHVPSLINILLWLGRLPGYQRSVSSTPLSDAICDIICPYLANNPLFCKTYLPRHDLIRCIVSLGDILNYLLFLHKGDYRRLCDRIFDIRHKAPSTVVKQAVKQESECSSRHPEYYFSFEKHLIRSLTLLLHSSLPLVWKSRLYKRISRWGITAESGRCAGCHNPAFNVVWTGCGHLHCHYCLEDFCCVCGSPVNRSKLTYP